MRALERFWTGCHNCRGGDGCAVAEAAARAEAALAEAERAAGAGGRQAQLLRMPLSVTAGTVFLLPLGLAIVAASLAEWAGAGRGPTAAIWAPTLAGLAGFFIGVAIAWGLLAGLTRRRGKRRAAVLECHFVTLSIPATSGQCHDLTQHGGSVTGAEQP